MRSLLPWLAGALVGVGWFAGTGLGGQDPPGRAEDRPEDRAALRALNEAFVRAFNEGDAGAIAGQYAEDARVVDEDGVVVEGRDAIRERFAAVFEEAPGARIEVEVEGVRFLAGDVAEEEGRTRLMRPDGEPAEVGRYVLHAVRRDGRWLVASVRDFPAEEGPPAEGEGVHTAHLKDLEWLVGDWVDESAGALVETSCRWSDDRNALLRTFIVEVGGQPAMSGTQRIGWDPLRKQVRSWVFDTEGGFTEGFWTREGERWVVKDSGVLADGRVVSATRVLTQVGPDAATWASYDRSLDGESLPDVEEIRLVRKPPAPGESAEARPESTPNPEARRPR